jgi:O-antigen/teichoic acid export membrane protein
VYAPASLRLRGAGLYSRDVSTARFATIFGSGLVLGQLCQFAWLAAGSRSLSREGFGTVLAAQALYGVLQFASDNGPAFHGARLAAAGALGDEERGSIVRLRLQLAGAAALVALALGAAGGRDFLEAVAPFALALGCFAAFGYWERFGVGDSRPWSAYLVLRGAGPAIAAGICLAASARLPLFVPGLVECAVIAAIALALRLDTRRVLVLARFARRGPWRSVVAIGLPNVLGQLSLGAGTILLGLFGFAPAAAVLAVSVRLLTGVNQLSGVVATSLFPQLARKPARGDEERDLRAVRTSIDVIVVLAASANAVLLAAPAFLIHILLGHHSRDAQATALLTLGGAMAGGYLVLVTMVLIARHGEAIFLRIYTLGAAVMLTGGVAVIALSPQRSALWMAAVLLAAQLLCTVFFALRGGRVLPHLRGQLRFGAVCAVGFAALGVEAALSPPARAATATALALVAVAFLARVARRLSQASPRVAQALESRGR